MHLDPLAVELGLDHERSVAHRLERLGAAVRAGRHHRLDQRAGLQVLPLEALAPDGQRLADAAQVTAQVVQIDGVLVVVPQNGGLAVPDLHVFQYDLRDPKHLRRVRRVQQRAHHRRLLVGAARGA